MFPGMTYCILSTDPDFVIDMSALLRRCVKTHGLKLSAPPKHVVVVRAKRVTSMYCTGGADFP